MPLPRIQNPNPVTKPATEEKIYPDFFISLLQINTRIAKDNTREMNGVIKARPFNFDTGEINPDPQDTTTLHLRDMQTVAEQRAVAGKPALAEALAKVLEAVNEVVSEGETRIGPQ